MNKVYRGGFVVLLLFVALLLAVLPVVAQGDGDPVPAPDSVVEPDTPWVDMLPDTLPALLVPNVIMAMLSVWLNNVVWFQGLTGDRKHLVIGALTLIVTTLITAVDYFVSAEVLAQADQLYQASLPLVRALWLVLIGGTSSYLVSQTTHGSGELVQEVRGLLQARRATAESLAREGADVF